MMSKSFCMIAVSMEYNLCHINNFILSEKVAGIAYFLSKGMTILDAAQYGVACSTAATMNPGTQFCKKEYADHLFKLIRYYSMA